MAALDVLALLAAGAALVIVLTGGGTFEVAGNDIRARSVGNLLMCLGLWSAVRYATHRVPLLGIPSLQLSAVPERSREIVAAVAAGLGHLPRRTAFVWVCVAAGLTAVIKLILAGGHQGFFSGDDVEIHEMTLGVLRGEAWPVWDLRSAFYPMGFVYPAQWAAWALGMTDVASLVIVGRLVVVVFSTLSILAVYLLARRRHGTPSALVAAVLLATSSLFVEFGATELPRPVASLFVFGAYACLAGRVHIRLAGAAGVLLAVAACLRFSEVVFLAPAVIHLSWQRQWRHVPVLVSAFAATAGAVQFVSDAWYWGIPFHSARAIFDFTLVERLSSRGYDPWWYYLSHLTSWSDWLVVGLALTATRRHAPLGLWVWLPVAALSLLPHKEPRYLLPIIPLLSLLAACGLVDLAMRVRSMRRSAAEVLAVALLIAFPLRSVDQLAKYRVGRTDAEVMFARQLASCAPPGRVALEQAWRFGGHLYLGHGRAVIDLAPGDPGSSGRFAAPGPVPTLIGLSADTCATTQCEASLRALGYVETHDPSGAPFGYRVFVSRQWSVSPPCS